MHFLPIPIEIVNSGWDYFKDILVAIPWIATAIIAYKWLNTWKDQDKWKTRYKIVKDLLKATYRLKEAIAIVRNPFVQFETDNVPEHIDKSQKEYYQVSEAYSKRWEKITEATVDISEQLLEVKIIMWDNQVIEKLYKELQDCRVELRIHLSRYLRSLLPNHIWKADYKDEILYSDFEGDWNDKFSEKVDNIIHKIETMLRPFLTK